MKILDFPVIRQSTLDTCSCACVQACLCYYGFNHREGQIRNLMRVKRNPAEVHPRKIVKVIKHFNLKARYKRFTIDEVIQSINLGVPVVLNIQAWSDSKDPSYYEQDNSGHYATAIGYDEKKKRIIFSDPCSFLKVYLSYEELEKRWHDGNKTDLDYDHMGVAVWGKKPSYKSDRIIRMG